MEDLFEGLTEETYIGNLEEEEGRIFSYRQKQEKAIRDIEKKIKEAQDTIGEIKENFSENFPLDVSSAPERLLKICKLFWKYSDELYSSIYSKYNNIPVTAGVELMNEKDIAVSAGNDILLIDIPIRLLKKKDVVALPNYHNGFRQPLYRAMESFRKSNDGRSFRVYDSRVVIYICSIYNDRKRVLDCDNVDTTNVVNVVSDFVLPDDSPECCSVYLDYDMGEKEHTLVYVVPEGMFPDFLKKRIYG